MELYRIRYVFGFPEIWWAIRQSMVKRRSSTWIRVSGTVEGYELLLARNNGWFAVLYSYAFDSKPFSGEWRKWGLFNSQSHEEQTARTINRYPKGARIMVRINPNKPTQSFADWRNGPSVKENGPAFAEPLETKTRN